LVVYSASRFSPTRAFKIQTQILVCPSPALDYAEAFQKINCIEDAYQNEKHAREFHREWMERMEVVVSRVYYSSCQNKGHDDDLNL
jgi:hypothetical protein